MRRLSGISCGVALVVATFVGNVAPVFAQSIDELVVSADRTLAARTGEVGGYASLEADEIAALGALHPHEALARVPGVWISRGSGQEHLTAIRSGVLTGAGACGAFLLTENGVPIRPAGFCNVNNLFELNTEQAGAIEVWRGPASAVLGGNALRGAINVVTAVPAENRISVETGAYDYLRLATTGSAQRDSGTIGWSLQGVHSNGYRDATGYGQQKASIIHVSEVGAWETTTTLNATLLNQETGGFVRGFEAYEDSDLRDSNPNPEAYRDAWAVRLTSHWRRDNLSLVPYLRRSKMRFLQHFLPGQPLEDNNQTSAGIIASLEGSADSLRWRAGTQLEYMQGDLREFQAGPTTGSAFLVETRPPGLHYDYAVDSVMGAVFYDVQWDLAPGWRLLHSARAEHLDYDYDNQHLVGNTRDDGSTCGFGGCRYTRPADRSDSFTDVAGRLGVARTLAAGEVYANVGSGFRAPQITELYRLQDGQIAADLESEQLLSFELGYRTPNWSLLAYRQRTRNLIFRDSEGFNLDSGRTEAIGAEGSISHRIGNHSLNLVASYTRHRYDFDSPLGGGELISDGNMVDTAPRWLANARWHWQVTPRAGMELEVSHVGSHYVNASNTARYDGHWVAHLRGRFAFNDRSEVFVRLLNVTDEEYADRADFAFGSYRYFPAMPRQFYVGISHRFGG